MNKEDYRQLNADKAKMHFDYMETMYFEEVIASSDNTWVYDGISNISNPVHRFEHTEEHLQDDNVQSCLYKNIESFGKTAVLNFASFKNPGGGFMKGMITQEEALCHVSTLYNVLQRQRSYYYENNRDLNKGLYRDRALYSPNVLFDIHEKEFFCDVITCAAPNLSSTLRYGTCTNEECYYAMKQRVEFIFRLAIERKVDTLVLGAFGCGVFKNNPYYVAALMRHFTKEFDGCLKRVIHPIPVINGNDKNYKAFEEVMNDNYQGLLKSIDQTAFARAMLR